MRAEPDAWMYAEAMTAADELSVSAATYLEAAIVADAGRDPVSIRTFDNIFRQNRISIEPTTPEQAMIARAAYRDFGRGSGHPAKLNFGDCFSYALASVTGRPLLFKGDDFTHTDITSALRK
ncbi:type II toxin-antitoxin system VapC family toxin [Pseudonocardia sp. CA-107938]|uniref:type II toxin-antitoxin system VapC family toxin n=1 Tax=Pseudonocardia sp. CA-107938 TaxID=3240021 RepID=UPI003D8F209B